LTVSPYIVIDGNNSGVIAASGDMVIDADFLALNNTVTNWYNCKFSLDSIDFNWGAGDGNIIFLRNCEYPNVPLLSITSPNTNTLGNGVSIDGAVDQFYLPFSAGINVTDALMRINNVTVAGYPIVTSTGGFNSSLAFSNSGGFGQIDLNSSGPGISGLFLSGNQSTGVNINSTFCLLATDADSLDNDALNFSGGATIAQVQFNTEAAPIFVSSSLYNPTAYTPTSPDPRISPDSVVSHLNGLGNAIVLQRAYDNGSGEILLDTAKPLVAQKDDGSPVTLWQIDALAEQMWFRDLSAVDTLAASAVFDVRSTTKGSRPCPSMTMAERDAIASPANGLTVFITDVSPQRLYIYNGAWTPLAYLSDIPTVPSPLSGIYTPTFTNLASFNAATFSNILSSYDTVDDIVGNWCCITTHFIVQATTISGVLGVSIPLGSDFTGTGQAQFVGGTIFESVSQAVLPGPFRGVDSATGNAIRVALTIPNTSLNLNLDVSLTLKYLLQ